MTIGFILVKTAPAKEYIAFSKLKSLSTVKEIFPLFGEYDFIVKMEAESCEEMNNLIFEEVETLEGIVSITTLCVVREGEKDGVQHSRWRKMGLFMKRTA
jgi:DNA-binding Lrp family transcriptional regulator